MIISRTEARDRHHQQAGIKFGTAERLGEGLFLGVEALVANRVVEIGIHVGAEVPIINVRGRQ